MAHFHYIIYCYQLVLPSNRFVITDSVEDALLTARKLLGESGGGSDAINAPR